MADLDFRHKYLELRAKFLKSTDTAYRLGYEQGLKDASMQQMQQQQAQQQQMQEMQMQQSQQQGQESEQPQGQPQDQGQQEDQSQGQEQPQGQGQQEDHLGQSMDELGNIVNKNEVHSVSSFLGSSAHHNLDSNQKAAVTMQKRIVDNILKKWEDESKKTSKDIMDNLKGLM